MKRLFFIGMAAAGVLLVTACGPEATPTPKPLPPTATVAVPSPTAVPIPTIAASPTSTAPAPTATAKVTSANCITCHTSKATLEALAVKKPEKSAETEGEG